MTHLLPRSRPEAQSVPSAALARLVEALDEIDHVHTLTVVRRGHVIAEATWAPYERDLPHAMYSVSKSFTSIAVGLAIDEGRFGIDDRVIDLLPAAVPAAPSAHLSSLRVRHLLSMATGHAEEPSEWGDDWAPAILATELAFEPGTHWLYNTAATYLLSEIVQCSTGERVRDYLWPRVLEPLGFEKPWWLRSPTGVDAGGFGLMIRAEELAAFGHLLLQRGTWKGRQLVPAEWIAQATSRQMSNGDAGAGDWVQGYGFQFWRCRDGAYRGDGAFGQYVIVMPDQEAVVAITGGLPDMQRPLDAVWRELLPAFDTTEPERPVRDRLAIPTPGGEQRAAEAVFEYDGPIRRLRIGAGVLDIDGVELALAGDSWTTAVLSLHGDPDPPWWGDRVAVSGGWIGEEFAVEVRALQDAVTYRMEVSDSGRLVITRDVGFDGTEVWEGDAVRGQPAEAHHSAVSP